MAYSYLDEFTIDEEHEAIVCHSKSGNTYRLTFDDNEDLVCTCKGFDMRKECRHVKEADKEGYADTLLEITRKNDIEKREKGKDTFCRKCGKEFDFGDNYCARCGNKRA